MTLRDAFPWAPDLSRAEVGALGEVLSLVPGILSAESAALPSCARRPLISDSRVTSTGRAIVVLSHPQRPPSVVLTVPTSVRAVAAHRQETSSLAALHEDERLADWRGLLPTPLAAGKRLEYEYRLDSALPGDLMLRWLDEPSRAWRLVETAAEAVQPLHGRTATEVRCDSIVAGRWVDARIDLVARLARRRQQAHRLERLRAELRSALAGCVVRTSWVHGDYWPGNILASARQPEVAGIVDWDAAAPDELALHDILHLLLYTRCLQTGSELGQIVSGHLRGAAWPAWERRLLDRHRRCHDDTLSERHALLFYWLRAVAFNVGQQYDRVDSLRFRYWQRRNVESVLAAL